MEILIIAVAALIIIGALVLVIRARKRSTPPSHTYGGGSGRKPTHPRNGEEAR